MPYTTDELREQLQSLKDNSKRTAKEEALYIALMEEALLHPEMLKPKEAKPRETYDVKKSPTGSGKDKKAIVGEFKEKFPDELPPEDGVFRFPNKQAAIDFFKDMAAQGKSFDMHALHEDHRMYSDGENFVQGTHAAVAAYLENPDDYNIGNDGELSKIKSPFAIPDPGKTPRLEKD
jgi:hypothetical protein